MALYKYFKHSPGVSLPQSAVPTVPADTLKAVNQEVGKELEKECKRGEYLKLSREEKATIAKYAVLVVYTSYTKLYYKYNV